LKIEKTTAVNKPFLDAKIVATRNGSRRMRGIVLSHVSTRFAFLFAISTILLLPSLSVIQINQSAWAGTFPGPNGQIAFSSDRDGNFEIYTMSEDGSDVTRLTEDDANDFDPSWSPDGDKIAFVSFRDGSNNMEIYVMNADGTDQTRLTDNDDALDREPSWSPDGEKITFASNRDGNYEIYVMNADGTDQTRLTDNDDALDREPSWSPDGESIAFVSDRDSIGEDDEVGDVNAIYTMDADDGSDVTRLTDTDVPLDSHPSWSPDGEKIAFVSFRDGNNEIYSMDADDGSDVTRLTDDTRNDLHPSWSPDGEKITFASNRDTTEGDEIYSMDADDGSDVTRLTDNDADDREPDWGTNTSTPGDDDDDKNEHDSKKKYHDDNAKKKH
jgi:Tol biopolymer transport system component